MSLGFEQAGFAIAAAVELDPVHAAVHLFNFPQCAMLCEDIAKVSGQDLLRRAGLRRSVDVVFGGPPCQGFSLMGKRAIHDPRNRLVLEFLRIVTECSADYFVFENVPGLTVGKHRRFLTELVALFEQRGYRVRLPWQVLNASHYGVPQNRRRLFLLGAKAGLPLPVYPTPSSSPILCADDLFDLPSTPTVWDAIGDLPDADQFDALLDRDWERVSYGVPSAYAGKLRGLCEDPDDFSAPRVFDPECMTCALRTSHSLASRLRFSETPPGEVEQVSRFFKLDPDGICNTLRAGTASDRGAFTSPRPIHPIYPRCITVREAARLHSYPDWFRFHITKWHGARQIGNSVPPLLARAVAACIAKAGGFQPEKPTASVSLGNPDLLAMNMREASAHFRVPSDTIPQRTRKAVGSKR